MAEATWQGLMKKKKSGSTTTCHPIPHSTNCTEAKRMCSPKGVRATSEDKHILAEVLQQERCIASSEEEVP